MSMMLPFVTAGLGLGMIVAGWRVPAVVMFVVTLALYSATLVSHMTDTLAISL